MITTSPLHKLQARIQKKFGSISNFSRISGIDRTRLQVLFRVKNPDRDELNQVRKAYMEFKNVQTGNVVDPERLKKLKKAIDDAGGPYKFTKDTVDENGKPIFETRAVYYVFDGERTRLSKLMKRLLDHFQI
jgi:hypothetical protein